MIDPMALQQEGDENAIIQATSKPFYIQFARFVSTILSPATVSFPAAFLIAMHTPEAAAFLYAGLALLFISIGPMVYIIIGVCLGKFSDVDVSVRSQRVGPYLFGITSSLIGFFVLQLYEAPKSLTTVMLIAAILGIIMMFITLWWKISMHAATLSGVLTLLTVLYGIIIWPAYLLLPLVGWSRVVLRRHTLKQVIAGTLLSMIITLIILAYRSV